MTKRNYPDTEFQRELARLDACAEAREWVGARTREQAWRECERLDWLRWYALAPAFRARDEAIANAVRAYDEATAPAGRAHAEAIAHAGRARDEAIALANRARDEAIAPARR